MRKFALLLAVIVITACSASMEQRKADVMSRASYELACPEEDLELTVLEDHSTVSGSMLGDALLGGGMSQRPNSVKFGAQGCEKSAVYEHIGNSVYREGGAPDISVNKTYGLRNRSNFQSSTSYKSLDTGL